MERPGPVFRDWAVGFGVFWAAGSSPPEYLWGPLSVELFREVWKLSHYLRPAFLYSLPHPTSNRNSPRGYWPSGSLLNGVIPGWGGACFHSLGAACCSKGCLLLTSRPGGLLPCGFPNPTPGPDLAVGILLRWSSPGQKNTTI